MTKRIDDSDLRIRAEAWLRTTRGEIAAMPTEVIQSFVYDLQVYQVELAMQNEELAGQNDELRRVESQLEQSRDRYQALYELAPVAYLTLDKAAIITELNQQASTLLGIERSRLLGTRLSERLATAERVRFAELHTRALAAKEHQVDEFSLLTREGERRVLYKSCMGLGTGGQDCALVVLVDVTEQRRIEASLAAEVEKRAAAEKILRQERDFAERLLATNPGIFLQLDPQGRVLRCNHFFEQFLGYTQSELLGLDAFALMLPKPSGEAVRTRYDQLLHNPLAAFQQGESDIVPVVTRAGQERIVAWTSTPVSDEQGKISGILLSGIDVTERRRLEADLLQAQKMESLGQLASGIAHDFNNLLMGLTGLTEIATSRLPPSSPALPSLTEIRQAAAAGAGLTRQLLDFARKRPVERVTVDLSRLVERAGALLRCLVPAHIEVQFRLGDDVYVQGDPGQLEQVLLNLVANARDAMPGGGKLRISTSAADAKAGQSEKFAMLAVSDNGVGMDEATQRRAFDPFFTTKPMDSGTGLGLSTVYGIVTQSGGHIQVQSGLGKGSTFRVFLPQAAPAGVDEAAASSPELVPGNGETILVIEDEASVRTSLRHRLQRHGYTVLDVENGAQALAICTSPQPIELAITDIILPGMLGDEVAREILKRRPGMPILYMSAFPPDRLVREGRLPAHAVSLQKPFSERELLSKIKELLAPPRPAAPAPAPEASAPTAPPAAPKETTPPSRPAPADAAAAEAKPATPAGIVLLVEDDEIGRMVLQELLELANYTVLVASGAEAALQLASRGTPIDLVVADYGLPHKNGMVLIRELLATRPTLKAILITGRALHDPALTGAASEPRLRLLRKPFEFDALLAQSAALLHSQQG